MSDTTKAAERLRADAYDHEAEREFFEQNNCTRYEADCKILARAYLAEHDETPLTKEWLRSVGGKRNDHPHKIKFEREDDMPIGLWHVDDGWKATLLHSEHAASCIVRGLKTHGDWRRLAAALGIPLKESR